MALKLTQKRSTSIDHDSVLRSYDDTAVSLRATLVTDSDSQKINVEDNVTKCELGMDLKFWEQETSMLSVNNFDNRHFEAIVQRGEDAVPFIYEQLLKGPSPLVHALECIYPEKVKYKGFVSLSQARRIWLKILKKQIKS